MKTLGTFIKILFLVFITAVAHAQAPRMQKEKSIDISSLVQQKQFVFKAESVLPMTGRFQVLTSDYDVKISSDSLVSYLPYFGRAYTAPIGSTQSPLDFVSTKFSSTTEARKKGRWIVTIKPLDNNDVRELVFHISPSGQATLSVSSNNRQSISFNGSIEPRRNNK
jgi:hypothetical protein